MTRDEFFEGFKILAAIPYSSIETIRMKADSYYKALKYVDRFDWLDCVDHETQNDDHLAKGLKSPAEYVLICQQIEASHRKSQSYLDKQIYSQPLIRFLNACITVGNEKNETCDSLTNLAGCLGLFGRDEARRWERVEKGLITETRGT